MESQYINITQHQTYILTHEPDILYDRKIKIKLQNITESDDVGKHMDYFDPLNISNSAQYINKTNTVFHNNNMSESSGVWYCLKSDEPVKITHFGIMDSLDNTNLYAKQFALESSSDGIDWVRHSTIENHVYINEMVVLPLDEAVTSTHFRIYCVEGNDVKYWELTRFFLFSLNVDTLYIDVTNELSIEYLSETETILKNKDCRYYSLKVTKS